MQKPTEAVEVPSGIPKKAVKKVGHKDSKLKIANSPTLAVSTKLMKAADKHGMRVRDFVGHTHLMTAEGLFPNRITPAIIEEATYLMRVWDHELQNKVLALGGQII